ncbi:MAG: hypothetical protein R3A48_21995 [Polyangiales bacterium]
MRVDENYPQLRFLLWNRASSEVSDDEAFALYESNRAWVSPETMPPRERRYFDALVARFGRGVFLG